MPSFRNVYASENVSIHTWDCDGAADSRRSVPENGFVFTLDGTFRIRSKRGYANLVSSGSVLFVRRSDPVQITHPSTGGDRGVVVRLGDRVLSETGSTAPPPGSATLLSPTTMLRLRGLLALLDGEPPRLDADVRALDIVSGALDILSDPREGEASTEETREAHRDAVERVKVFVGERYAEPLRLEEIAREACYSMFHLCRVFKSYTGVSVHRYVNRVRLVAALEMLESRVPVTETALRVGFSTPSHFSDVFRRELGLRPTDAREAMNDPVGAARLLGRRTAVAAGP